MKSDDDSPSVIGADLPPMPTREDAERAWRERFAARIAKVAEVPMEAAMACAEAGDVDLSVDPVEAADDEMSYWDADE